MDDAPHHSDPPDWNPPTATKAALLAALAVSEAEAKAGLLVSGDEIMRELRESIARMEGRAVAAKRTDLKLGSTPRR